MLALKPLVGIGILLMLCDYFYIFVFIGGVLKDRKNAWTPDF